SFPFPLQKAPPKHSLRSFPPGKTCRRRRTQPIPAESGDYLHFLNGFAKSLPSVADSLTLLAASCTMSKVRALSSAVRAFGLHPKGRPFKSDSAHHPCFTSSL